MSDKKQESSKIEFTPEQEKLRLELSRLNAEANSYAQTLHEQGVGINPDAGKLEALVKYLVDIQVITLDQALLFEIMFMKQVNLQLNNVVHEVAAQQRKKDLITPRVTSSRLMGPNGRPL